MKTKPFRWPLPALGGALILLVALFRTHFMLSVVVGESMLPTFEPGDLLVVDKRAYRFENPKRGDLIVARHRQDVIVKRVVGLPEEAVEITDGDLIVNGATLPETYIVNKGLLCIGKGQVGEGKFAIVGDNRAMSRWAIVSAVVPKEQILGKVIFSVRLLPRQSRAGVDDENATSALGTAGFHAEAPRFTETMPTADADTRKSLFLRRKKLRSFFCHRFESNDRRVAVMRNEYPS